MRISYLQQFFNPQSIGDKHAIGKNPQSNFLSSGTNLC